MSLVTVIYTEYKRLEEELTQPGAKKKLDEKTYHYFSVLKNIFEKVR